ncbi:MAG: Metallo-beta-lactamase family protein, RNA-specific [Candidatus Bipolaricaulis sibiricus]|uniref:Metallo-beta-lactamase family protein, RNA-specific n=1 Tax=Bipolaricaulis sibiricus TaxID=2501609 RepID=A0A410FV85_BIPS1|nr:MAG: Metallo-beta-lactamase family protein, RNA-specific [Candidatus Bipolaricaulis sibiricus]
MKLTFAGAAGTVTGSCFHVETDGQQILVDCGMFQGLPELEERNCAPFPFDPKEVDWVLLTHGHLDHLGLIPRLVREGFRGRGACTPPTRDIAHVMLMDAARIQEEEGEAALYTAADAVAAVDLFQTPLEYGEELRLGGDVRVRFHDAGHILGAASVELRAEGKTVVFSGDLGNRGKPLVEDPSYPPKADVVVLESTYGDREHPPVEESVTQLRNVIVDTLDAGGNVVIPSFALERTQEVLYLLFRMWRERSIPACRIFLDSPLATQATRIFERYTERFPAPARRLFQKREDPFDFELLEYTLTRQASKKIGENSGAIIIAGSGMCTGGRILYHLRDNLPRPESALVFVGYQAVGTLGREIEDGASRVEVLGSIVPVRASVHKIEGLSAHADLPILVDWTLHADPSEVFLVHGEPPAFGSLAQRLASHRLRPHVAEWYEAVTL